MVASSNTRVAKNLCRKPKWLVSHILHMYVHVYAAFLLFRHVYALFSYVLAMWILCTKLGYSKLSLFAWHNSMTLKQTAWRWEDCTSYTGQEIQVRQQQTVCDGLIVSGGLCSYSLHFIENIVISSQLSTCGLPGGVRRCLVRVSLAIKASFPPQC